MNQQVELQFETLLSETLENWPQIIDLAILEEVGLKSDRYSIRGLGRQAEEIEQRYIGEKGEVILRELHWSIFTVIHAAAKNVTSLRASSIRVETVRSIFEQRLRKAIEARDVEWSNEDFELVMKYFEKNKQ